MYADTIENYTNIAQDFKAIKCDFASLPRIQYTHVAVSLTLKLTKMVMYALPKNKNGAGIVVLHWTIHTASPAADPYE